MQLLSVQFSTVMCPYHYSLNRASSFSAHVLMSRKSSTVESPVTPAIVMELDESGTDSRVNKNRMALIR